MRLIRQQTVGYSNLKWILIKKFMVLIIEVLTLIF